jgi:GTP pyrophosphokinase
LQAKDSLVSLKEEKEIDPYLNFYSKYDISAEPKWQSLLRKISYITSEDDIKNIKKAFSLTVNLQGNQKRASGEPYYYHPVEVAEILAEYNADAEMIAAGLMHDILEDTDYPPEKMKEVFGERIYLLVDGVTKLSKFSFSSKEERQAENFRRMFMAMAKDIRVIVIKLADRLHNMRTLNHLPLEKQKRIARETLEIFAPLANRLGIGRIKWELEDMCFRYLHNEEYAKITKYVAQKRVTREIYVNKVVSELQDLIQKNNIKAEISGRPKHFYSIYQKMIKQNKEFHEIFDITAVRIIVGTKADCYEVLGLVHSIYKPVPGRFKDYIAMPKPNLYQSLHTTVIGPEGYPLEIQIRTQEMHKIAEYGIAAHWLYKEKSYNKLNQKESEQIQLSWLKQLIEWQNDLKDASEYLNTVKVDLFADEVFVFTPKGDVYSLPQGSTPVDFAYRIHTDVGHRCIGAKVNGKLVPLNFVLKNGDQVEVMLSKVKQPSLDWMNFVVTSHAKNRIRQWFKKEKREENIAKGKEILEDELEKNSLQNIQNKQQKLEEVAKKLNQPSLEEMYASIGYGEITPFQVISRLKSEYIQTQKVEEIVNTIENKTSSINNKSKNINNILVDGIDGLLVNVATCCSPIPGEPIKGVVSRTKGIVIHSEDCVNLKQVNPNRIMEVSWGAINSKSSYSADIEIKCLDRLGLLKDIIAKLSDNKINILGANVTTNKDKTANINLKVEVNNIDNLQKIINTISKISDVLKVTRIKKPQIIRRKNQELSNEKNIKSKTKKNKIK